MSFSSIISLLMPKGECILCLGSIYKHGLCEPCFYDLPVLLPELRARSFYSKGVAIDVYSLFSYGWPISNMQQKFKYSRDYACGQSLANVFAYYYTKQILGDSSYIIIPCPMHWRHRLYRGVDHALLQASYLTKKTGLSINTRLLKRTKSTRSQVGLSKKERMVNLRNAFICTRSVVGKNIILFDDVVTTGATMMEMASTLKKAGAVSVTGISLARVDL